MITAPGADTKPAYREIKKIEMKNDGKDAERFGTLVRKVVNVPKEDIKKREELEKKAKRK